MYYPYFRGKQFELIAIREMAELMANKGFVPIIEPVKDNLSGLGRVLDLIYNANGKVVVIVNPRHGYHRSDGREILTFLDKNYSTKKCVNVGILLTATTNINDVLDLIQHCQMNFSIILIHAGFTEERALASQIHQYQSISSNVFVENHCGKLYRQNFTNHHQVLLRDGFIRRPNREYPQVEFFSDLHVTYKSDNVDGFGDFLIVGDDYSESGGPAYAVAIHLTFIDPNKYNSMYIYHFVSDRQDTPTDPAGKFGEALTKLVDHFNSGSSKIFKTAAVGEFFDLHERQHFPGLGYIKKLSMIHHIQTLAQFL